MENGIEVVVNGTEPYAVEGEPRALAVREEFRIDLESESIASLGLTDIVRIDFDPQGRIWICGRRQGDNPLVFAFDVHGGFVRSFLRPGQGPGEVEFPRFLGMTPKGEILVLDTAKLKILFFDGEGILLREIPLPPDLRTVGQFGLGILANGNYLAHVLPPEQMGEIRKVVVRVLDSHFRKLNDLIEYEIYDIEEIDNPILPFPVVGYSRGAIYASDLKDGTDISVFDLDGKRIRIIRKSFSFVPIPAGFERTLREGLPPGLPLAKTLKLPRSFPAFQYFFAEDDGRLFVVTYEKNLEKGQSICDVFSPDGVFVLRAVLGYFDFIKMFWTGRPGDVVIHGDRMACAHEKDNGFKEVIVSSCQWL
jgi:hypothetical protein